MSVPRDPRDEIASLRALLLRVLAHMPRRATEPRRWIQNALGLPHDPPHMKKR